MFRATLLLLLSAFLCGSGQAVGHNDPLSSFFNDHSVRIMESKLIHVHKVCLEGGKDGFVVPDIHKAEQALRQRFSTYLPGSPWPLPFRAFTRNEEDQLFRGLSPKQFHGPTYFMNCWRTKSTSTNPAHWLMKVSKMFYVSEWQRTSLASARQADMLPTFENLAFHQCASLTGMLYEPSTWLWGKYLFFAATKFWTTAKLWTSLDTINIVEMHMGDQNWTCFDDIFFDPTYGMWSPGLHYQASWAKALREEMITKPSTIMSARNTVQASPATVSLLKSMRTSQRSSLVSWSRRKSRARASKDARRVDKGLEYRCRNGSIRISIFQRQEGTALRQFQNLGAVRAMLTNYTSYQVDVVTVTSKTPVQDQGRLFADGFDLLVTSHGSQLANMILCDPNRTAVVEVIPIVYDTVFENNAKKMGFRSYITSTGHRALCDQCDAYTSQKCSREPVTGLLTCAEHRVRLILTQQEIMVDVDVLSRDVNQSLRALCNVK